MLALAIVVALAAAGTPRAIEGVVTDTAGTLVAGASVYVRATDAFAVTDARGRFRIEAAAGAVIVATYPGLRAAEAAVEGEAGPVTLVLGVPAQTETVTVRATGGSEAAAPVHRLTRLQVLRMPGSAADPLRAVQMLPGVAKADEGAGLFVRGGDVSETATYLDRALVPHPYRAETASGGLFGTVPSVLVSGLSLSTGGFPARYGGVLSAVLELQGLGPPPATSWLATLGLAGGSALVSRRLGPRFGVRGSLNHTQTRLLFAVNPPGERFSRYPVHTDSTLTVYADLGGAGRARLFALGDDEGVGVDVEEEAFRGSLESRRRHGLAALAWERLLGGRWLLSGTASASHHDRALDVGVIHLDTTEAGRRVRLDVLGTLDAGTLRAGIEAGRDRFRRTGETSVRGGDLAGISGVRDWDQLHRASRTGAYVEWERSTGALSLNGGVRADRDLPSRAVSLGPRLGAVWRLGERSRVRVAGGLFYQAPHPAYLDAATGNPGLRLMRARHLVVGYEYGTPEHPLNVRVEAYDKAYRGLPVEDPQARFTDDGRGFARGVDVLLGVRRGPLDGFVAASALRARRRQTPFEDRGRYPPPTEPFPPSFDVPYTLQSSARVALPRAFSIGVGARLAAGAPLTPIVAATPGAHGGFVPVYGEPGSERLPAYRRVDLSLSRLQAVARGTLVAFVGLTNAVDHTNVFEYAYSPDFTQRRPVASSRGRSVYFGVSYGR